MFGLEDLEEIEGTPILDMIAPAARLPASRNCSRS
jgi:hypothetical protein